MSSASDPDDQAAVDLYRVLAEYNPLAKWWRAPADDMKAWMFERPSRLTIRFHGPDRQAHTITLSPDLDYTVIHEFGNADGQMTELWVRAVDQPTFGGVWVEGDPNAGGADA